MVTAGTDLALTQKVHTPTMILKEMLHEKFTCYTECITFGQDRLLQWKVNWWRGQKVKPQRWRGERWKGEGWKGEKVKRRKRYFFTENLRWHQSTTLSMHLGVEVNNTWRKCEIVQVKEWKGEKVKGEKPKGEKMKGEKVKPHSHRKL